MSRAVAVLLLLSACGKDKAPDESATPFAGREALSVSVSPAANSPAASAPSAVTPVFRPVEGQPGWLCGDLGVVVPGSGVLLSLWYRTSSGPGSVSQYTGSCASFASNPLEAAYKDLPGTNNRCADLPGGASSMIFQIGQGVRTARMVAVSCFRQISNALRPPGPYLGYGEYRLIGRNRLCADSLDGNGWSAHFDTAQVSLSFRRATCDYAEANPGLSPPVANPTPLAPSSLAARELDVGIALSWRDNSVNEGNLVVERAVGSGPYSMLRALGPNVVAYTDTSVASGTTYTYRIRAYNSSEYFSGGGYSASSNVVSVDFGRAPLGAPSSLRVTGVAGDGVSLSWNDGSQGESGFLLERAVGSGPFAVYARLGANVRSFTDPGAPAGNAYRYRLRAFDGESLSPYSNTVGVNKPQPSGLAPSGLSTVTLTRTSITVRWSSTGASSYLLERSTDGVNYRQIVATGAAILRWEDRNLTPNTRYYYRLRASYGGSLSGYSPVHSVPTSR